MQIHFQVNVRSYFLNLKIRIKLLLAFGSLLIILAFTILVFFFVLEKNKLFEQASEDIDGVSIAILEMDGAVKYFMFEGFKDESFQKDHISTYITSYKAGLVHAQEKLASLQLAPINLKDSIITLQNWFIELNNKVKGLEELLIARGFKDYGKEGQLRAAIHTVENSSTQIDRTEMLMLRRHEKDFFLRRDLKYQSDFNKRIESFIANVRQGDAAILANLDSYKVLFNEVVDIEKRIGLKDNEGYKGMIGHDLVKLKVAINQLRSTIKTSSQEFRTQSQWLLIFIFAFVFILGLSLAIIYSNVLTKAIKELHFAMKSVSEGLFPSPLPIRQTDEIGKTKAAFNALIERLQAAARFSAAMGKGDLTVQYDERFQGDVLSKSMTTMQLQLKEALDKQKIVNWINQGSAMLNEILKNEQEDIALLGDKLLKMIVQYLDANQGALYVLQGNPSKGTLERIATYAYNKKRFVNNTINIGEGLVGQCFLERSEIVLKEVPADYVKITSGLGEAVPRFIVLIPLIIQGQAMGVMELASFESMEEYKVSFLKKMSESIASILKNKQIAIETKQLLQEAKNREQRLSESEEELRQNAEEMQAVQEQTKRQQMVLEDEIAVLRQLLTKNATEKITTFQ